MDLAPYHHAKSRRDDEQAISELERLLTLCETAYYTATRALDVPGMDVEACKAHHAAARTALLAHVARTKEQS